MELFGAPLVNQIVAFALGALVTTLLAYRDIKRGKKD